MARPAAIGVIFDQTKESVFLVKRRDVPVWVLPGGGIDAGETPEQSVVREMLEETGLKTRIVRKVAEYTPVNCLAGETHLFVCMVLEGEAKAGEETAECGFFRIDKLPRNFFFIHRAWVNDALQERGDLIKKRLEEINYINLFFYFFRHPVWVGRMLLSRLGMPLNKK